MFFEEEEGQTFGKAIVSAHDFWSYAHTGVQLIWCLHWQYCLTAMNVFKQLTFSFSEVYGSIKIKKAYNKICSVKERRRAHVMVTLQPGLKRLKPS